MSGTPNPNRQQPQPTPEHSSDDDPYAFFTSEHIDQMRAEQLAILTEEQGKVVDRRVNEEGVRDAYTRAHARFDETRRDHLNRFGITEDNPDFDNHLNGLRIVSWDTMSGVEWEFGKRKKDGTWTQSGRSAADEAHELALDLYRRNKNNKTPSTPINTPDNPADDTPTEDLYDPIDLQELLDADDLLTEKRDKLAEMAKKRQGQLLTDKMQEEFDKVHKEYIDALVANGKVQEKHKRDDRTQEEKNESVLAYLAHEGATLRELTNEKWADSKVGWFCNILASGNFAQRVAKGVAIGVVISGTVAAATIMTGGGAAVSMAGGALLGGGRLMRAYGAIRGRDAGMTSKLTGEDRQDLAGRIGNADIEAGARHLANLYESAVDTERLKNRRAVAWSVGSLAVGSYVGVAIEHAVNVGGHVSEWVGSAWQRVQSIWGNRTGNSIPDAAHGQTITNTGSEGVVSSSLGHVNAEPGLHLGGPHILSHITPEQYAHFSIHPGEGGYELVKYLGGNAADWNAMQDHLLAAHPNDFYRMSDGKVGLAHTGRLSDEAIADIAQRLGVWHV